MKTEEELIWEAFESDREFKETFFTDGEFDEYALEEYLESMI